MTLEQLSAAATELLPCPFCGGEAVLDDIGDRTAFYSVGCNNNACKVEAAANMRSKEEAIHHWNQRTGQLVAVADDAIERVGHWSDCAVYNAPAYEPGPCDCGGLDLAAYEKYVSATGLVPSSTDLFKFEVNTVAQVMAEADAKEGCKTLLLGNENYMNHMRKLAKAAIAAMKDTQP